MTTHKEALKLALEALEPVSTFGRIGSRDVDTAKAQQAITAIKEALAQPEQERCVGCEACIDTACGRDECPKGWPKAAQPEQEPVAWVPYLSDRADGVKGRYAIARWNPRGYREVWNLRRHEWGAYSDDVLSLEEADTLLRLITIPTRKVTSPQPPQPKETEQEPVEWVARNKDIQEICELLVKHGAMVGKANAGPYLIWLIQSLNLNCEATQRKPLTDGQKAKAVYAAVGAIYFDDSSDYESALWAVVKSLAPDLAELLKTNPSGALHQAEARKDAAIEAAHDIGEKK